MISVLLALVGVCVFTLFAVSITANRWGDVDTRPGPAELLDGIGIAAPGLLLLALISIRAGLFNRSIALGLVAVAVVAVEPRRARRLLEWSTWVWGALALIAGGVWLRRNPVYFLGDWSDFGEYVNRGNSIADGGLPGGFFPPLTESYLALGHLMFSERHAMTIVVVLSVLTGLFVAGVAWALTRSGLAAWVAAALFVIHPVAVWFGRLPTSEVGYGLLSTILAFQLIRASQGVPAWPVALTVAAMVVSRPNGLVLVLPFAAIIVIAMLASQGYEDWRPTVPPFVVGWVAGFVWLANFDLFRSVVATFGGEFGVDTADLSERLGTSRWQGVILVAMAVYGVALYLIAGSRNRSDSLRDLTPAVLGGGVALSFLLVWGAGRLFMLRDGFSAIGYATIIAAALGVAALLAGRLLDVPTSMPAVATILAPATMWTLVYAFQFDETVPHYIYLYWERYLFPNVFLGLFVFAGVTAAVVERWLGALAESEVTVAVLALVPFALVPSFASTYELQHHRAYHGEGFYDTLAAIDAEIPSDATVAYSGVPGELIWDRYYFFFPNTFRVIAHPLSATFGVEFTNLPTDPRAPDPLGEATESPSHLLSISLEPRPEGQPLAERQFEFPIALLPRDSVGIDDWDEWTVRVTVSRLR